MGWPVLVSETGQVTIVGCGDRDWADCATVSNTLESLRNQFPVLTVIEGGAPGADQCVANWAASSRSRGVTWTHIAARWGDYPDHERWRAGHDRNGVMAAMLEAARDGHHHTVAAVAFKAALDEKLFGPRPDRARGGTEDMIRRAWAADIDVWYKAGIGHPIRQLHRPVETLL